MTEAIIGIDPTTRLCAVAGANDEYTRTEMAQAGLIIVPVSNEVARESFSEVIEDIYSLGPSGP